MKGSDRAVLLAVPILALLAAFYLMVLSPKRKEASDLSMEVTTLQTSIDEQEQVADFAQQARKQFPRYYGRLVVLGKAVPDQADQASMLVQLSSISDSAQVKFRGLELGQSGETGGAAAAAAAAPSTGTTAPPAGSATPPAEGSAPPAEGSAPPAEGSTPPADASASGGATPASAPAAASSAPATEAAAATLPIGATVGAAGLPTLPYDMFFKGGFFQVADFIGGVDGMVHSSDDGAQVDVNGRLLTIDGFSLEGGAPGSNPELDAQFVMTSYVTPAEQGLTLGASPTGPATGETQVTPASAVSP